MRGRLLRWTVFFLFIAAAVFLLRRYTAPETIQVAVKPVSRGTVERTVANTRAGTVKACRRAKLSPSIGGQIARLPVRKGDHVKEGQLLIELWNKDLAAQEILAERELTAIRFRHRSVCIKAAASRRNAERISKLRQSDAASQEHKENAEAEASALEAECEAVRAEIEARKAHLEAARANLERTRLLAPFDGVIGDISGELYEYVTPSPLGVATLPAVDIIDNRCFYVSAPIDEVDALDIQVGMPARITMDAFGKRRFQGVVRRIADYVLDIEKQARTVDVEATFLHPEDIRDLLAGYSADIEVILDVRRDVVRAPTESILYDGDVFVFLPAEGRVVKRHIQPGLSNWDHTEVMDGLSSGDLVVVNVDNPDLKDGASAVRLQEEP